MPSWFPAGRAHEPGWRFDAVGLLAVLGEASMTRHAQALTSSRLCMLPRLMPAPATFIKSSRPLRLPSPPATVIGVFSGTRVNELNYFADMIHPISDLKPFQVEVYNIGRSKKRPFDAKRSPVVLSSRWSPLRILSGGSVLFTLGALIWAILLSDGPAVLALVTMPLASSLIGGASYWRPQLAVRSSGTAVPRGDVVVRSREGAFVVVHCSEHVARELYTGAEECNYWAGEQWFRVLVGSSTILVMVSMVLLGNCTWVMQVVISTIYLLLHALYWLVALFPANWCWDLSYYEWENITPERDEKETPNYTRALWYCIQATKTTDWVTASEAAPRSPAWQKWLDRAYANCNNEKWNAVAEKDRVMEEAHQGTKPVHSSGSSQLLGEATAFPSSPGDKLHSFNVYEC